MSTASAAFAAGPSGASGDAPASPGAGEARRRGPRAVRYEESRSAAESPSDPTLAEFDVLAFATDPHSERALREGLSAFPHAQVWPGDLRAAAAALEQGDSPRLVFVDIDGIPYPAGAIYELASVCEVGTIVIALGSDDTARFTREILLASATLTPGHVRPP